MDATRSEVWEALETHQNERREVVNRLVEIHYELKDLARDNEWPKLAKADLDPATGRETYEELMRDIEDDRQRAQQYALDALFAMKAQLSRAEWDALFNEGP